MIRPFARNFPELNPVAQVLLFIGMRIGKLSNVIRPGSESYSPLGANQDGT
jgi:hypothetical protein